MSSIELTATGRYFHVFANGVEFSKHTTEREAIERVDELKTAAPSATIQYVHQYVVDVDIKLGDAEVPPVVDPSVHPVSDGGVDLVDFLVGLDEQAHGDLLISRIVEAPSMYAGAEQVTIDHRDSGSWLARRISVDKDGDPDTTDAERVGLCWRGYQLFWHLRDRSAIRIGGAA